MAFKLIDSAQDRWRAVNAPHLVALVRAGARFERGVLIERETVDSTSAAVGWSSIVHPYFNPPWSRGAFLGLVQPTTDHAETVRRKRRPRWETSRKATRPASSASDR
jgi:hypothetical protein